MAGVLAIPSERLAPTLKFNRIVSHFEPLVEIHLSVSDLLDEAEEEARLAGVEFPEDGLGTVADYIQFMMRVREAKNTQISGKGPSRAATTTVGKD